MLERNGAQELDRTTDNAISIVYFGMASSRRDVLRLATGAAALVAVPRVASAQAYPARPVKWVVGYAPAGGNDIVARLMGQWLSERTGQQFRTEPL